MKRARVHSYARPDRRYLRGRANRSVRRRRLRKAAMRWSLVLGAHLLLAVAVGWSAVRVMGVLRTSPHFGLQRVQVVGARMCSRDGIAQEMESLRGRNILAMDLRSVAARLETHPWVLRASVKRVLPRGLRIHLVERTPMAVAVVNGSRRLVDEHGIEIGAPDPDLEFDLPLLTGLDRLEGDRLARGLDRGVDALRVLRSTQPEWAETISEIRLSRADRIEIVTAGRGPRLWLDPDRADRNLGAYLSLREDLGRRIGEIDYVDLRWRNRIALKPVHGTSSNRPGMGRGNQGA